MRYEETWLAKDSGEIVLFRMDLAFSSGAVQVWIGDELDPGYFSPEDARRAADEWPTILRALADKAEAEA